ncbi:hypothetical protein D3C71_1220830 [compost metagenome]
MQAFSATHGISAGEFHFTEDLDGRLFPPLGMGQDVDIVFGLQEGRTVRAIGCVQRESLILDQDAVATLIDAGQFDNVGLLIEPTGGENGIGHATVVGQWVEARVFHFPPDLHDLDRLPLS